MAREFRLQRMQTVAGRIHIAGPLCHVQGSEQPAQPRGVHWLNPGLGASFGEELQPFAAIAPNRLYSVYEHYTISKKSCHKRRDPAP